MVDFSKEQNEIANVPTLKEITARRPFGWFAVKQNPGPKPGICTDEFFKRNWELP